MVLGRQNHVPAECRNASYSSERVSKCMCVSAPVPKGSARSAGVQEKISEGVSTDEAYPPRPPRGRPKTYEKRMSCRTWVTWRQLVGISSLES